MSEAKSNPWLSHVPEYEEPDVEEELRDMFGFTPDNEAPEDLYNCQEPEEEDFGECCVCTAAITPI